MTQEHQKDEYFYFVDDVKYETPQATLTGAQIKARVPNLDPTFVLVLEGQGNEPDQVIGDDTSVSLKLDKGPKRFYTAPPATFG